MISKILLRNAVEQVLHVPGNYRGGILEMAFVLDCSLEKETVKELAGELAGALKQQSEVFRNVRLNVLQWRSDTEFVGETAAMPLVQMGTYFDSYRSRAQQKHLEFLTEHLKKFYARSKLILVLTDGAYRTGDEKRLSESLKPFLEKKLIFLTAADGAVKISKK